MKTVRFETTKIHGLFVKLPELQPNGKLYISGMNFLCYTWLKDIKRRRMVLSDEPLPKGYNWQLQGFITNLTDDQKEAVCEETDNPYWYGQGMKWIDYKDDSNCFVLVSLAFTSLLESLKVFAVNPIPEPEMQGGYDENGFGVFGYDDKWVEEYHKFQQHVGNWVLLTANK